MTITKKGKWKKSRDDEYYLVWERDYRISDDNFRHIAQYTFSKKSKTKEFWIGWYNSSGQQRGHGFFWKSYSEILKEYKPLFSKWKN